MPLCQESTYYIGRRWYKTSQSPGNVSFLHQVRTIVDRRLMADYLSNHFRFQFDSQSYPEGDKKVSSGQLRLTIDLLGVSGHTQIVMTQTLIHHRYFAKLKSSGLFPSSSLQVL